MVKIRALYGDEPDNGYKAGDVFDASHHGRHYCFYDKEGHHRIRRESEFELLSDDLPSPIRTVTRKEIVAGKYGIVTIKECGFIHINAMGTPDNLREAAHILNQIAEVLEDGTE